MSTAGSTSRRQRSPPGSLLTCWVASPVTIAVHRSTCSPPPAPPPPGPSALPAPARPRRREHLGHPVEHLAGQRVRRAGGREARDGPQEQQLVAGRVLD